MMENEKDIVKNSNRIFAIIGIVLIVISMIMNDYSLIMGFCLGYCVNLIILKIIVRTVDSILSTNRLIATGFVATSFLLKMLIYATGFILAIKIPKLFNLFTVTIGYFVVKLAMFHTGYRLRKGGE